MITEKSEQKFSTLSGFLICFLEETQELPSQFPHFSPLGLDPGHAFKTFSKPKVISDANVQKEVLVRAKCNVMK